MCSITDWSYPDGREIWDIGKAILFPFLTFHAKVPKHLCLSVGIARNNFLSGERNELGSFIAHFIELEFLLSGERYELGSFVAHFVELDIPSVLILGFLKKKCVDIRGLCWCQTVRTLSLRSQKGKSQTSDKDD